MHKNLSITLKRAFSNWSEEYNEVAETAEKPQKEVCLDIAPNTVLSQS